MKPFILKIAKLDGRTVTITETKGIPAGKKGNDYGDKPVIAFWYDVTTHSNKEIEWKLLRKMGQLKMLLLIQLAI
ncbi:hypothetical protein [Kurthia sibirica]|nr:hypothetical protein [Kurthia sibirica]